MKKRYGVMLGIFIIMVFGIFVYNRHSNSEVSNNLDNVRKDIVDNEVLPDTSSSIDPTKWVAVDGVGRSIDNNIKVTSQARYVGMFYWTWHMGNNQNAVYNVNEIIKKNPTRVHDYDWWNNNYKMNSYWWNEPIYGYYMENDDYVLRKQAELLSDAGVDFVAFDCTNGALTWKSAYENLLKVWKQAKSDGVKVPGIVFLLPFANTENARKSFMDIYNNLYDTTSANYKKYSDLLFRYNGKPLLLWNNDLIEYNKEYSDLLKNFEVRKVNPSYFMSGSKKNGTWDWLSTYPQAYYLKANGKVEQTTVGVAQNASYSKNRIAAMNGYDIMGRSYAKDNYSYNYTYRNSTITVGNTITGKTVKDKNTSLYGRNFQQQWDYAISLDPEVVFVTGWNEWIMGRFKEWPEGYTTSVSNAFPDEYNDEYSRDIEPSKGELKDNYYNQLVANIRKYKGASSQSKQTTPITIDINKTSDWSNNNIINYNHYSGGLQRDIDGFGKVVKNHYTNKTFRNDIVKAKVSYDSRNIYFYVETKDKLTSYTDSNWMRLLIDTKSPVNSSDTDNWEEFEYIVNRNTATKNTMTLEKSTGGWKFNKVGDVRYTVNGKILQVEIPRGYLGMTGNNINFNFKWCDNNLVNGDIMSIYTDGDAAPGGRFAFQFSGTSKYDATPIEVTSVSISPNTKTIKVGESVTLTGTVSPSTATNKTITWTSSNSSIATVDTNGKVTGIKEGTVTINGTSNNKKVGKATITVVGLITLKNNNVVMKDNNIILKIKYNEIVNKTLLLKNITINESNYEIKDTSNKVVSDNTLIGTGSKLIINKKEYPIIIMGDINSDGKITSLDYIVIRNHLLNKDIFKDKNKIMAADVYSDNKVSSLDYIGIKNIILNG